MVIATVSLLQTQPPLRAHFKTWYDRWIVSGKRMVFGSGSFVPAVHSSASDTQVEVLKYALSLCFNHEEFCDELYTRRKTLPLAVFVGSGGLLDSRIALRPAREPPLGPSGRASAGFRRLGGRAHLRQKRRNDAVDPNRRQAARVVAALPRQSSVGHARKGAPA